MLPNNYSSNVEEERKRQFKRQQDRLKMMAPDSERKAVSADAMIDSLLKKSDTFKKNINELPPWLQSDSPLCCPYYEKVWEIVRVSEKLVDTPSISQLLLTSGLHPNVLGYIWNLANRTTPGQLTKQELFIVLALVGLAQSGCTFNSLSVLNLVPTAPLPRLNVPFQPMVNKHLPAAVPVTNPQRLPTNETLCGTPVLSSITQNISSPTNADIVFTPNPSNKLQLLSPDDDFQDFQSVPVVSSFDVEIQTKAPIQPPTFSPLEEFSAFHPPSICLPSVISNNSTTKPSMTALNKNKSQSTAAHAAATLVTANTSIINNDSIQDSVSDPSGASDEFSDFQSADAFDTSIVQPSKITLPKLSSFIKVSPESERKLRHLGQPESLTALPESKISSRNQVSSMPSIAVLGSSRGVGSRLANHSLGTKDKTKHHQKHLKIKPIISTGSAVVSSDDLFPKCLTKSSSFILKETKIPCTDLDPALEIGGEHEHTRRIEIPSVGTFKETTLPVDMKSPNVDKSIELLHIDKGGDTFLSMEEDKYGALRELEQFRDQENQPETEEDFGEFLSADLPSEKAVEAWNAWNSSVNVPETSFETVFEEPLEKKQESAHPNNFQTIVDKQMAASTVVVGNTITEIDFFSDKFDLTLSSFNVSATPHKNLGQITPQEETKNNEPNYFDKALIAEDELNDFGDFVTPSYEKNNSEKVPSLSLASIEDNASIHSSTPSFDLSLTRHDSWSSIEFMSEKDQSGKTSKRDSAPSLNVQIDSEPQQVASRCLQCCYSLLKEAVKIFSDVSDRSILQEVFETEQAQNYIRYLRILYYIARRISQNRSGVSALYEEIMGLWQQLEALATTFSIPLTDTEPEGTNRLQPCGVCKAVTTDADIEQDGGMPSIRRDHNGRIAMWNDKMSIVAKFDNEGNSPII